MTTRDIVIRAIDPRGPTVHAQLGDGPETLTIGQGWQWTKRPKREAFTEFMGFNTEQFAIPIKLGEGEHPGGNIDPQIATLIGIMRHQVGPRDEPAVCSIETIALPRREPWILQDLTFTTVYRGPTGHRYMALGSLTVYAYVPTDLTISGNKSSGGGRGGKTPAQNAAHQSKRLNGNASSRTYTVRAGDTLERIAQVKLGSASRWNEIASLNAIRDPRSIKPGQVLRLP